MYNRNSFQIFINWDLPKTLKTFGLIEVITIVLVKLYVNCMPTVTTLEPWLTTTLTTLSDSAGFNEKKNQFFTRLSI